MARRESRNTETRTTSTVTAAAIPAARTNVERLLIEDPPSGYEAGCKALLSGFRYRTVAVKRNVRSGTLWLHFRRYSSLTVCRPARTALKCHVSVPEPPFFAT